MDAPVPHHQSQVYIRVYNNILCHTTQLHYYNNKMQQYVSWIVTMCFVTQN